MYLALVCITYVSPLAHASSEYDFDAENGFKKWSVLDQGPAGAFINIWYDETRKSQFIEFAGSGIQNGYVIGSTDAENGWNNRSHFGVAWKMLASEPVVFTFWLNTSAGFRALQYSSPDIRPDIPAATYRVKLAPGNFRSRWITVKRNIEADLRRADPSIELRAIHGLVVRGSVQLDDLRFRPINSVSRSSSVADSARPSLPNAAEDSLITGGQAPNPNNDFSTLKVEAKVYGQIDQAAYALRAVGLTNELFTQVQHYEWDFGDGSKVATTSVNNVIHAYATAGRYKLTLKLKSDTGVVLGSAEKMLAVTAEKTPAIRTLQPTLLDDMAAPVMDGIIDEAVWLNAAPIHSLTRYPEVRAPNARTEVRVLVDKEHLYIAFKCFTFDPDSIKATQNIRDYGMGTDDRVTVEIDSFANARSRSTFYVNAIGTQSDIIMGGGASKIEWKGDWSAGATRTDYGWSAEMAIPFSILNFDPAATEFGVNFWRYQSSTEEWSSWVGDASDLQESRTGKLVGLTLDGTRHAKNWTIMPYVTGSINGADINGVDKQWTLHGGLTARYQPRPNVTLVADVYPDFTQLESQYDSIDLSYSERYLADVRPFFQEGGPYFNTSSHYFYSRRIPNFYTGLKAFSEYKGSSFGGLVTVSPEERTDGMVRFKREYLSDHEVELVGVATNRHDLQNQVFGSNLAGSWDSGVYYNLSYSVSNTQQDDNSTGHYVRTILGRDFGDFDFGFNGSLYELDYQPANGLVSNNLPDTQGGSLYFDYLPGKINDTLTSLRINGNVASRNTADGERQKDSVYFNTSMAINNWLGIDGSYIASDYRPNLGVPGEFGDFMINDQYLSLGLDFNIDSKVAGFGIYLADGTRDGGDYRYQEAYTWAKPVSKWYLKLTVANLESFGQTDQYTLFSSVDLSAQDSINAQYYYEEGFEQSRILYRRAVRSGIDLYGVFQTSTGSDYQFSVKSVWTM